MFRAQITLLLLVVSLLLPSNFVHAQDTPVEGSNTVYLPIASSPTNGVETESNVSQEQIQQAMQAKLALLPATKEWGDAREHWFSEQMEAISTTVQASQLMSSTNVFDLIDMTTAPQSPELNEYIDNQVQAAGGIGDHNNSVDLSKAQDGDILLGYDRYVWSTKWGTISLPTAPWGFWKHAAIWRKGQIVHAPGDNKKVRYDAGNDWKNWFDAASVLGVWASGSLRADAANYASNQVGEDYWIWTPKLSENSWYCSKLPWSGYYWKSSGWWRTDLDSNGGYWVVPDDLWYSSLTYVKSYSW